MNKNLTLEENLLENDNKSKTDLEELVADLQYRFVLIENGIIEI